MRYFFIIEYDEREIDDPDGVVLPNDAAGIEYGRRIIEGISADIGQAASAGPPRL